MLKTDRGFWKALFFNLITFGIYEWYLIYKMAEEANIDDTKGKNVGGLLAYIFLGIITFGIYALYWNYRVCEKFADTVKTSGRQPDFNGGSWLLWSILGSIIIVGPIIAFAKQIHLWNDANEVHNRSIRQ